MSIFKEALKEVLMIEGGYSHHPADRGGETKFGITKKTARAFKYKGDMRDLPLSVAQAIYHQGYWKPLKLDKIAEVNKDLAFEMFEQGVNFGNKHPRYALQKSINAIKTSGKLLTLDGIIGPQTLRALKSVQKRDIEKRAIVVLMNTYQSIRYVDICMKDESQKEFILGWLDKRIRIPRAV